MSEVMPELSRELAQRERQTARDLIDRRWLLSELSAEDGYTIPRDIADVAIAKTGLSETGIATALGDDTHPATCDARIAVVEAVLADPEAVPADLLRAICRERSPRACALS